ncbi:MAG TPA: TIGR00730 family Rossman fold protein [Granulicella sp.]
MNEPDPLANAPLAYENPDFLHSTDARTVRILAEYLEPLARFQQQRIKDTVVFFGSARFRQEEHTGAPAQGTAMASYYEDARTLAHMLTRWTKSLPGKQHRFVVTSGGGPGIMEAANRGAYEAGGKSIGLNILLPHEKHPNRYITPELNFGFHYFFMRKFWFAYMAKALVIFPGGFGTMDEMFEIMTLAQTYKLARQIPVIIYSSEYWKSILNFDLMVERGAISSSDLELLHFAETPEEAFSLLKASLDPTGQLADQPPPEEHAQSIPSEPLPPAQEILGPDLSKTR